MAGVMSRCPPLLLWLALLNRAAFVTLANMFRAPAGPLRCEAVALDEEEW